MKPAALWVPLPMLVLPIPGRGSGRGSAGGGTGDVQAQGVGAAPALSLCSGTGVSRGMWSLPAGPHNVPGCSGAPGSTGSSVTWSSDCTLLF